MSIFADAFIRGTSNPLEVEVKSNTEVESGELVPIPTWALIVYAINAIKIIQIFFIIFFKVTQCFSPFAINKIANYLGKYSFKQASAVSYTGRTCPGILDKDVPSTSI